MRIFGLDFPLPSQRRLLGGVCVALAVVLGHALGLKMGGLVLEREAAIATFVAVLYVFIVDQFVSHPENQVKRYSVAGAGFAALITVGAAIELIFA